MGVLSLHVCMLRFSHSPRSWLLVGILIFQSYLPVQCSVVLCCVVLWVLTAENFSEKLQRGSLEAAVHFMKSKHETLGSFDLVR